MTAIDYPQKLSVENTQGLLLQRFPTVLAHLALCKSITYDLQNSKTEVESAKLG